MTAKLKVVSIRLSTMLEEKFAMIIELFFFVKKYLLVGASGMLWTGGSVSGSVRDVCMSHQSDWIYYKQPIKFLVIFYSQRVI